MRISINRFSDGESIDGVFEPGKTLPWINKKLVAVHVVIADRIGVQYQIEGECVTMGPKELHLRIDRAERQAQLDADPL